MRRAKMQFPPNVAVGYAFPYNVAITGTKALQTPLNPLAQGESHCLRDIIFTIDHDTSASFHPCTLVVSVFVTMWINVVGSA